MHQVPTATFRMSLALPRTSRASPAPRVNWGAFFAAQPDTSVKLAAFAFAVEHLECGAYEMLRRVAEGASDPDTARTAEQILAEEHAAAERIWSLLPEAVDVALDGHGVGTVA